MRPFPLPLAPVLQLSLTAGFVAFVWLGFVALVDLLTPAAALAAAWGF